MVSSEVEHRSGDTIAESIRTATPGDRRGCVLKSAASGSAELRVLERTKLAAVAVLAVDALV